MTLNNPESLSQTLTIVVPVRIIASRLDILNKINWMFDYTNYPAQIRFLIVDDGSSEEYYKILKSKENQYCRVITTNSRNSKFNLARARNVGALNASSDMLMFMDADLLPYPGFFDSLLKEIELLNLKERVYKFLMIPVIYLTGKGYEKLKETHPKFWQQFFINQTLLGNNEIVDKYSSGTSVIVVEKYYYLSRGGQDERFEGWGYEDYEFTNRLILRDNTFPRPKNYLSMKGNFMTLKKFEGWKAVYRLYGDWMMSKGVYLLHIPHAIDSDYHSRKNKNLALLLESIEKNLNKNPDAEPQALLGLRHDNSLLFRKNPFCFDRTFSPFLGKVTFVNEEDFSSINDFERYLLTHKISRVVFPNPYANMKLKELYCYCRQTQFPYLVCERGALPDSIYHDPNGFLTDSTSYNRDIWDVELTREQKSQVINYIESVRAGEHVLEKQAERRDVRSLKKTLGIAANIKVVLVPFQQPNDTVVKYFSGSLGGSENFRKEIVKLVEQLGSDWKVLYRKHPVEDSMEPIKGAIQVDDINIYDLLEISDAVVVLNSGVGIYALMFQKPLYVLGEAWYASEGLCKKIHSDSNLAEIIRKGSNFNSELMFRFIYYLRFKFYSFGTMTQRKVRSEMGQPITATSSIEYYELRGWGKGLRIVAPSLSDDIVIKKSPLFDRYAHVDSSNRIKGSSVNETILKKSISFKIYCFIYQVFLSKEKKQILKSSPQSFFEKAKHPFSKIGKHIFRHYL